MEIPGHYFIVGVTAFCALGVTVTYTLSVSFNHVTPLWCYISYTGNYPVESCIFSLVFNLSSAIYVFIVFLRYLQVADTLNKSHFPEKKISKMKILNTLSVLSGGFGSFGLSITGCFQQRNFHLVHIAGVILCTYLTFVFLILQTYFTYTLPPLAVSTLIKALRTIIVIVASIILSCGPILSAFYFLQSRTHFEAFSTGNKDPYPLSAKVGAGLEWLLFILYQLYICSFCSDFMKITVKENEIELF